MKSILLTTAAIILLSASAASAGSVTVVVEGPKGQSVAARSAPKADAVKYCIALGGKIAMDLESRGCTKLSDGGYKGCRGACYVDGKKID